MMEYKIVPTKKVVSFSFDFEIESMVEKLKHAQESLYMPFILDRGTLNNSLYDISGAYYFSGALDDILSELTSESNIWKNAEISCVKDEEWSNWRNRDLLYPAYSKYTFKPEYADKLSEAIQVWITELTEILSKLREEAQVKKQQKEERKKSFEVVTVYTHINPTGGEDGEDGFYDAELRRVIDSQVVRIIAKNIFDFGFIAFPHRFGGTEDVVKRGKWTEIEKEAHRYVCEFSPFTTNIRV